MIRRRAVQWFGYHWRMPEAVGYLAPLFNGWDFELQVAAVDLLQKIVSPEALELLSLAISSRPGSSTCRTKRSRRGLDCLTRASLGGGG